jgi:mono/diheme cytochrome c family protein
MKRISPLALCLALAAGGALAEGGDEFAAGRDEYLAACASCHGEAADGKGPIASMFRVPIPDLTGIAARNEGVFPTLKMIQVIDGRAAIRGHGDPMPIFGRRYQIPATDAAGAFGSEVLVRARILELVTYLQSIQK